MPMQRGPWELTLVLSPQPFSLGEHADLVVGSRAGTRRQVYRV